MAEAEPIPSRKRSRNNDELKIIETDLLIIGTGPAGASLACFLAQHGLGGIMLAASPGTSHTPRAPRANIANMAALECTRDLGLEEECMKAATKGDCMQHTRWCRSMIGEEFARIYSWGNDSQRVVRLPTWYQAQDL